MFVRTIMLVFIFVTFLPLQVKAVCLDHIREAQGFFEIPVGILTSIGNDIDFKFIFSRQIEAVGKPGDIAIAITTSGNSLNLIEGVKAAKKKKILTFCFSGNNGGKLKQYVDQSIIIPSKITSQIQVAEILIGQTFCEFLEDNC